MGWKDWPYWKKGGVIGSLIYLGIILLALYWYSNSGAPLRIFILAYPTLPWSLIPFYFSTGFYILVTYVLNLLLFFLIGSIIGKVIWKNLTSKKQITR